MSAFLPTVCAELLGAGRSTPRNLGRIARRIDKRAISSTARTFRPAQQSESQGESSRSRSLRVDIPSTSTLPQGVSEGVPRFLAKSSLETLDLVQGDLWKRLQAEIRNQPLLQQWWIEQGNRFDIASLITKTAQEPSLSLAYNYACLILNNSFFLERLSVQSSEGIPQEYRHLEQQVVARAMGMTGSGWLWIASSSKQLRVLPTYGAGTLLVRHGVQVGRSSGASLYRPQSAEEAEEDEGPIQEMSGATATGNDKGLMKPLACVSLFEHAYMPTYGVLGKEQYVRDWFRSLNWDLIKA